ncbi:MAG: tRNA 2-thiouridine(34) synthase MnmA [Proteobacteria bacterium]|nr:tRNA 2-thiouridine(34) synthase MnmA [Pseudomonadota bacterium]
MNIAVLLSGGVDSSVALRLLQAQGHTVTAFYLKIWLEDELSFLGDCPWQEDLSYVQAVCKQAGVELKIVSFQKEYHDTVIAYAIEEIKKGLTPNPDIMCNSMIKFGAFYDAFAQHYDKIATGHYAGLTEIDGTFYLKQTPDAIKDQTYFLARLSQAQLSKALFPLGDLTKQEVRQLAQTFNLPNKDRKDSQGLCFLGKIKFSDFIKEHIGTRQGPLVEFETGKILAYHEGFWFYTIGQRKGIKLSHGPWYVVAKDAATNTVFISKEYHDETKQRDTFTVTALNWFSGNMPDKKELLVKMRHGPQLYQASLTQENQQLVVRLAQRDQGIATGQFAVFYDGQLCLGCGVIEHVLS